MKNITKTTVYVPVKVEDELPEIGRATFTFNEEIDTCSFLGNDGSFKEWYQHFEHKPTHWLKPQEAIVFTPEQLNEYTKNVGKTFLETAAEKVRMKDINEDGHLYEDDEGNHPEFYVVDKQSIINTFEETFKKFEV